MATKLKAGDKVRVLPGRTNLERCASGNVLKNNKNGYLVLRSVPGEQSYYRWTAIDNNGEERDYCSDHGLREEDFILLNENNQEIIQPSFMTNLIQSFTNLFVSEPQKSFLKAGITDQNGNVTPEGNTVFTTWLLNQPANSAAFKTAVVDPLLAESESAKK